MDGFFVVFVCGWGGIGNGKIAKGWGINQHNMLPLKEHPVKQGIGMRTIKTLLM